MPITLPQELLFEYTLPITSNLYSDYLKAMNMDASTSRPWVIATRSLVATNPHPVIATSASSVGMITQNSALINLSTEAYHLSLRWVLAELRTQTLKRVGMVLILAIGELIAYEISASLRGVLLTDGAWERHLDAKKRIMQSIGAASFTSELGQQLLVGEIPTITYRALASRKASFVASQDWIAALDFATGVQRQDRVWIVASFIPGCMQRLDELCDASAGKTVVEAGLLAFESRVQQLDLALDIWMSSLTGSASYWTSTCPAQVSGFFSKALDFASLGHASTMGFYWTYKLLLSILTEGIEARRAAIIGSASTLLAKDMLSYQYASLICRSATYWLRDASSVATETMLHGFGFPYRIAWEWFAGHGHTLYQERLACEEIHRVMSSSFYLLVPEMVVTHNYKPAPEAYAATSS